MVKDIFLIDNFFGKENIDMSRKISIEEWSRIIASYNPEESTVVHYCKQLEITKSRFYYYRDKFQKSNSISTFLPVKISEQVNSILSFTVNDISLKINTNIDDESLKRLIRICSSL